MPSLQLPIADGFYISESEPFLNKRIVNWHPIIPQSNAINQRALFGVPGIVEFADETVGPTRGSITFKDGTPYFVIGSQLFSFDSSGNSTDHGTITGDSDLSMSTNGININIQDPTGDNFYFTPSTNTLELNDDPVFLSFGQAKNNSFKDGFYNFVTDDKIFTSSLKTVNDGKDFNALDFSDAEFNPDKLVSTHNSLNQLYVFNERTAEVFETTQTTGFPYTRIPGAIIQKGCSAPFSIQNFNNGFVFMGGDFNEKPSIYYARGSSIQKISTSSIDQIIHGNTEEDIFNARSFTYALNGNFFYVITVGDNTFEFNATTSGLAGSNQWNERQTGITRGEKFASWRATHAQLAFDKILVGDDRSGKVGFLDIDTFTEYGELIEGIISTKPFIEQGNTIFNHKIELLGETGVGNDDVVDPQMRHTYSDDGGRNYSNEVSMSMGKKGAYKTRMQWSRLGSIPNNRILRFITTEPCRRNVYALYANAEVTSNG